MGTVTLPVGGVPGAYNDHLGQHGNAFSFFESTNEIEIRQVDQATMDAALITYTADQANIDNDFADKIADIAKDLRKDRFDDNSHVTATIKEMVIQLNELRALHGLPDLNFGTVNASIRNRID